jgi:hypothetical protein
LSHPAAAEVDDVTDAVTVGDFEANPLHAGLKNAPVVVHPDQATIGVGVGVITAAVVIARTNAAVRKAAHEFAINKPVGP